MKGDNGTIGRSGVPGEKVYVQYIYTLCQSMFYHALHVFCV